MIASLAVGLAVLFGLGILFWPRIQHHLIVSDRVPAVIREFAAASLSQNGLLKQSLYLLLLPFVDVRLPRRLTAYLCRIVGRQQGIDFSEVDCPIEDFPTLNAFFARALRSDRRPICADPDTFISPADADITAIGTAAAGKIIEAKGTGYLLEELLPAPEATAFAGGRYAVMYLRPGNCHRVFCPDDAKVTSAIRVPGGEMPISPPITALVPRVFVQNRRMAHMLETGRGRVALIMIGAYKVGRIVAEYDPSFSPIDFAGPERRDYSIAPALGRGEWLATFYLGSAIVLLFPPGSIKEFRAGVGARLNYGAPLATWEGKGR